MGFPRGKFSADDEGELSMLIAVVDKTVIVDFGKAVHWIGLDATAAREVGQKLIDRADEIEATK